MSEEWFQSWFDSPYYHLLYSHRNDEEAHRFIDALLAVLKPLPQHHFIDVGCGRGRHSRYLRSLGFAVTGIDLSQKSIDAVKDFGDSKLKFITADIRQPLPTECADVALNLFTSFGYFSSIEEHLKALKNIKHSLRPMGLLVLDYFNASFVKFHLVRNEELEANGIEFKVSRSRAGDYFEKHIEVHDAQCVHHYRERVAAFSRDDLVEMLSQCGFSVLSIHGDYSMQPYQSSSPRVIIIAQSTE